MGNPQKIDPPAADKAPWERKDPDPARHIKTDPRQKAMQKELDKQLKGTFPASDAPSVTGGTEGVGKPTRRAARRAG
jgi:hypothetical protein